MTGCFRGCSCYATPAGPFARSAKATMMSESMTGRESTGGRSGARGYLLQTLSSLLDALNGASAWDSVTIEPDTATEKVDILWTFVGKTKAVQVKSSTN